MISVAMGAGAFAVAAGSAVGGYAATVRGMEKQDVSDRGGMWLPGFLLMKGGLLGGAVGASQIADAKSPRVTHVLGGAALAGAAMGVGMGMFTSSFNSWFMSDD